MNEPDGRKKIVLGVTGGVAAYKSAETVRRLQDRGLRVQVVMTAAAQKFVAPLTFAALTGEKVITSLFSDDNPQATLDSSVEHIGVAQSADLLLVAPATADVVAKLAHGIADDFLTTMHLAFTGPVAVAPAMNVNMWEHPATQANLHTLRERGVHIIEPDAGALACGMTGPGRLAEPDAIAAEVERILAFSAPSGDLLGRTVLITAGPTQEALDPVRYLSNRSSGRMGYALAEEALSRGARVILITGPVSIEPPGGAEVVRATSAVEMHRATIERIGEADIAVLAAAVADFRPSSSSNQKIKKNGAALTVSLEPNPDILADVSAAEGERVVVGFAAETENLRENAERKLRRKGCDFLVANLVGDAAGGTGFDSGENQGLLLAAGGESVELPRESKRVMARRIFDAVAKPATPPGTTRARTRP